MILARTVQGDIKRRRLVNTMSISSAMRTVERLYPKETFVGGVPVRRGKIVETRASRMGSGDTVVMRSDTKVGVESQRLLKQLNESLGVDVYYHVGRMSGRIEKFFPVEDVLVPKGP